MTVKEFWSSKDKLAIHCNTEEKANKLLAKFDELGKKWCSNRNYMECNNYRTYLDLTCYNNRGGLASNNFYSNFGYQVIEFDDLEDFKQENNIKSKSKILDNVEFDYLWNIIKPFKDKVEYIQKDFGCFGYFIRIHIYHSDICLPYFQEDSSMYKGMEADEQYTLEELGFVEPKPTFKFKVGDVVKVVNGGLIYSTYSKWEGLTDELRFKYTNGQTVEEDREAIVRSVGELGSVPNCLLCAIETLEGNVFIINERGLELIKEKR